MKNIINKKIRADVVGSLLRLKKLLSVQDEVKKGLKTLADLTLAEDQAVRESVKIQEKAGLDVVTDGEMRRPVFCHNLVTAVDGFEWNIPGNTVIWFDMRGNKIVDPVTVGVVRRIKQLHDVSAAEFSFLRAIAVKPVKVTIPSPTIMTYFFMKGLSDKVYPKPMEFLDDVTSVLQKTVNHLEALGASYIQIDAPEFGMLLDPLQREWFTQKGFKADMLIEEGIDRINQIFSGFVGIKALHICRGNDKNRFMARGGYDVFAKQLFIKPKVDRLLPEFDSDRAGGSEPLKFVTDEKTVVLGLITTKSPVMENVSDIIRKIHEAARIIPLERLAISTQCGFASVAKGNNLSFKNQQQKLKLVAKIARSVWND